VNKLKSFEIVFAFETKERKNKSQSNFKAKQIYAMVFNVAKHVLTKDLFSKQVFHFHFFD
jgi:hypothetical protein